MTPARRLLLSLPLVAACATKPAPATEEPTTAAADDSWLEGQEEPEAATPEVKAPSKAKKAEIVSRDRDQAEERRKLEASRKVSATANQALKSGNLIRASDLAREALRVHEQNADAMLVLAEVFYKQKKYELALSVTSTVLQIDERVRTAEDTSRAYNVKGFSYLAMGKQTVATRSFRKAAETDARNASAWNNLGAQYLRTGNIKSAIDCFAYATRLDPRFYKAHLNHGSARRANREWKAAEAAYATALKLHPDYPEAYFNLGVLYLDADPYPGVETVDRLKKSIAYFGKYRTLAIAAGAKDTQGGDPADDVARVGKAKAKATSDADKPDPSNNAVGLRQADLYVEIAQKGLDRERRREERAKQRANTPAEDEAPEASDAAPQKPGEAASEEPAADASPTAPSPKPAPDKPGASKPGASKPEVKKPGTSEPE
ncbi:MAG: tetratricopeptide repeat protein, partial [Myxococcales bacterium]|nr:tetratricopeptide repeat protein [Myxococcales bacterium]